MGTKKTRIFTITLGYSPARILKESLDRYYKTNAIHADHYFVDQHYPLNREENIEDYRALCLKYGMRMMSPGRNLGLHHGFNWALNQINPSPDDIVIAYDPDSYPTTDDWMLALVETLQEPDIAWSTLYGPRCQEDLKKYICNWRVVAGRSVLIAPRAVVNTTCAWKISFLDKTGGLRENSEYYGHLESAMHEHLDRLGLKQAFLADHGESDHLRDMHDREFQVWKWLHAHTREYRGDFGQWIQDGMPGWDREKEVSI